METESHCAIRARSTHAAGIAETRSGAHIAIDRYRQYLRDAVPPFPLVTKLSLTLLRPPGGAPPPELASSTDS